MKSVGLTKRQRMVAATAAPGLKTIVTKDPIKKTLSGAGLDMDGDKEVAFLLLDDQVYSSTAATAIDTAEGFMEINEGIDPYDEEFETFTCELRLATSSKGREYISIALS